jgi:hypothetical protein
MTARSIYRVWTWLVMTLLAAPPLAIAQVPKLMRYQGQALDSQSVPLEGPYTLTFRLYDAASGGANVWEEAQPNVPLSQGHFSVLLGQVAALNVDWSAPRWLSVQVNAEPELAPRQQITAVPMASMAEHVDGPICTLNGRAGIGTKQANGKLQIGDCGPGYYNGFDMVMAQTGAGPTMRMVSFSDRADLPGGANLGFDRLRGTAAASSPVQAGDTIGAMHWGGQIKSGGMDLNTSASLLVRADAAFTAANHPSSMVFATINGGSGMPGETMRLTGQGYVGIGTSAATNIITVRAASSTNPIADGWIERSSAETKDVLRRVAPAEGNLGRIARLPVYEWRRKPTVSDEEAERDLLRSAPPGAKRDPPSREQLDAKKRELAVQKALLPKFAKKRLGLVIEDAEVPSEIAAFDDQGNKIGVELGAYVAYLHAAVQEAAQRIEQLEARLGGQQ